MQVASSGSPGSRSVTVVSGPGCGDTPVFGNLGVDSEVRMMLSMRRPDDDSVSIVFGHERFRLEFFDVDSLERIRQLAVEGVRLLRAAGDVSGHFDDDTAMPTADRDSDGQPDPSDLVATSG